MIRNLFKLLFYPLLGNIRSRPAANPAGPAKSPDPARSDSVHIFHGTFASELAATDYCRAQAPHSDASALINDLPDAVIDQGEVEIIFGASRIAAATAMFHPDHDPNTGGLLNQIGRDNTIIMLSVAAFSGSPDKLHDTPMLRYAGAFRVT